MITQAPETPKTGEPKKERVFIFDNREMPDPDPTLSIEEVKSLLVDFAPELHNAEVKQFEKDGKLYIRLIKKVGTKG